MATFLSYPMSRPFVHQSHKWHNHRSDEVVGKVSQFITAFSLFGNCHNICDRNLIDEAHAQALDKVSSDFCVICL